MRAKHWTWTVVILLLLAAGCGEVPGAAPTQEPTPEWSAELYPPTPTPLPYPMPTAEPLPTRAPSPTPLPQPTPIVLGAEWAPLEEQETYVSTTVVVAPVGDGPGQVGYQTFGEAPPKKADQFTVDTEGNIYILDRVNQRVVQFDPEGRFVRNIPYPDRSELWYPELLAVDGKGRVCLYDSGVNPEEAGVKCYDYKGNLLQKHSVPSWFSPPVIRRMRIDQTGVLWVEGDGSSPNAPVIDGEPYKSIVVPLGNATGVFDEEHQRSAAVSGLMCNTGTYFSYTPTFADPLYLYNSDGHRIYSCPGCSGRFEMDRWGNMYLATYSEDNKRVMRKYGSQGRLVASFEMPEIGPRLIDENGRVYGLIWGLDEAVYRVIRWQVADE